jgi:hypothetical protein
MVSIRSLAGETHDDVHKLILGYIGMSTIRLLAEVAWPVLLSALVGQGITTSLAFAGFVLGKAVSDPAQRAQIKTLLNIPYLATDHILPKSAVTWLLFLDVITSAWNFQFIPGLANFLKSNHLPLDGEQRFRPHAALPPSPAPHRPDPDTAAARAPHPPAAESLANTRARFHACCRVLKNSGGHYIEVIMDIERCQGSDYARAFLVHVCGFPNDDAAADFMALPAYKEAAAALNDLHNDAEFFTDAQASALRSAIRDKDLEAVLRFREKVVMPRYLGHRLRLGVLERLQELEGTVVAHLELESATFSAALQALPGREVGFVPGTGRAPRWRPAAGAAAPDRAFAPGELLEDDAHLRQVALLAAFGRAIPGGVGTGRGLSEARALIARLGVQELEHLSESALESLAAEVNQAVNEGELLDEVVEAATAFILGGFTDTTEARRLLRPAAGDRTACRMALAAVVRLAPRTGPGGLISFQWVEGEATALGVPGLRGRTAADLSLDWRHWRERHTAGWESSAEQLARGEAFIIGSSSLGPQRASARLAELRQQHAPLRWLRQILALAALVRLAPRTGPGGRIDFEWVAREATALGVPGLQGRAAADLCLVWSIFRHRRPAGWESSAEQLARGEAFIIGTSPLGPQLASARLAELRQQHAPLRWLREILALAALVGRVPRDTRGRTSFLGVARAATALGVPGLQGREAAALKRDWHGFRRGRLAGWEPSEEELARGAAFIIGTSPLGRDRATERLVAL